MGKYGLQLDGVDSRCGMRVPSETILTPWPLYLNGMAVGWAPEDCPARPGPGSMARFPSTLLANSTSEPALLSPYPPPAS